MGGIVILLLAALTSDPSEVFERVMKSLEKFEGRVIVRTIWWGDEDFRRPVERDSADHPTFEMLRSRWREFRIEIHKPGDEPGAVMDSKGSPRAPVTLSPRPGIDVIRSPTSAPRPTTLVLLLVPRRRGPLPTLRLEVEPKVFRLLRIEAGYENRLEVHELLRKTRK